MGDRYEITIKCAGCETPNEHYHAESSGYMSFTCSNCKKINWVSMGFVAKIISKKEEKKLYKIRGFEFTN